MSLSLVACGGGEGEESGEAGKSSAAYYILLEGEGEETNSEHDLGFMSDNISQETQFTLNDATLQVFGMTEEFGNDPKSVEGKTYEGEITVGDVKPCKVTIAKVTETGSDDMKTDYELEGTVDAEGKSGSFKVTMFKMNH